MARPFSCCEDLPVRLADILGLALSALWQQKVRTSLTTLGVVFGSFVLAASLSIDQGVQDTITRESSRTDLLRKITVRPQWGSGESDLSAKEAEVKGSMSDARRQRLRQAITEHKARYAGRRPRVTLTREKLRELSALEHVEATVPVVWQNGFALLEQRVQSADVASVRPGDDFSRQRLVAGRFFEAPDERAAVVSEFLLYRWGLTDDADFDTVVGKKLRLEFRPVQREAGFGIYLVKPDGGETSREEVAVLDKIRAQLPTVVQKLDLSATDRDILLKAVRPRPAESATVSSEEFPIVGVVRLATAEERKGPWDPLRTEADVLLPVETATDLFFKVPGLGHQGVDQAVVIVDREEHVKEVFGRVKEMGLDGHAAIEFIERERFLYLMIFGGMTCVAAVALLVAALGIVNTMLMSVLERTREIGIMKAVGAGNRHLQLIFVVEGALLGLLGGGFGLLLAWGTSFPGDAWFRSLVSRDLNIELHGSLFVFPLWLIVVVLLFAVGVTTLAAVYPARRAARVDPVTALRHE
jgi:putative ABC transport system permease protein